MRKYCIVILMFLLLIPINVSAYENYESNTDLFKGKLLSIERPKDNGNIGYIEIEVENVSKNKEMFEVYLSEVRSELNGGYTFYSQTDISAESYNVGQTAWVTFSETEAILDSGEKKVLKAEVIYPGEVEGEYPIAIAFGNAASGFSALYVNLGEFKGETPQVLIIDDMEFHPEQAIITAFASNPNLYSASGKSTFILKTAEGKEVSKASVDIVNVPPLTSTVVNAVFEGSIPAGTYEIESLYESADVSLSGVNNIAVQEDLKLSEKEKTKKSSFIFAGIAVLLLLVAVVLSLGSRRRSRK